MYKFAIFASLILSLISSLPALATDHPQMTLDHRSEFHGSLTDFAGASRDTIFLVGPWGSGAQVNGQFQNPNGDPAWNGWTSMDVTQISESHWHISDYNAADLNSTPNNLAMYCGDETFPACAAPDVEGGYGNGWNDVLQFTYTVTNSAGPCDVTVSGVFSHNTEPGYDFTFFSYETSSGMVEMAMVDGVGVAVPLSHSLTYEPQDYIGPDQDQVRFEIKVTSDGAWSDEDCLYSGNGACQVDDLRVQCSNGNFDNTSDFQDGLGDWEVFVPLGTGDFAALWSQLEDVDPCVSNYTPQVAFIDDGNRVPNVGPSYCITWCYGPGGYIVNTTGGAAAETNPDAYLYNAVDSPVLTWPGDEYNGASLHFDVYRHEDLSNDSPGMFYNWDVRSAVDPADLESNPWHNRSFVYYGGPDYIRGQFVISDLLVPGRTVTQVRCTVMEMGWVWGWNGDDGYPAPYFDNFRYAAFTYDGPALYTRELQLAQDNFPEIGHLDLDNLAGMNVRFDAARNQGDDAANVPGDSITCDVTSVRSGGELTVNRLHYTMQRNPVFDSVRDGSWGIEGFVDGRQAVSGAGYPIPDKFAYDLPDSGFLFPGDVLHYYISATDEVAQSDPRTATLPADISGFGDFSEPLAYNSSFQVHCLPSVNSYGNQPTILFWNDFANRGGEDAWFGALTNLGYELGEDYDLYYTNAPTSGVGNGLGGRATTALLSGYEVLLYTCGNLRNFTISNGDSSLDPGNDVQLLTSWFEQGEVKAFFSGDDLVSDLFQSGPLSNVFLSDYFNVNLENSNIRPMINNQATPLVKTVPGNSVFYYSPSWVAYGGCLGINTFDAVTTGPEAERLARFTDPAGNPEYIYSAATLNHSDDDKIISLPYDLMYIYSDQSSFPHNLSARADVLEQVLNYFELGPVGAVEVPGAGVFSTQNYPNPFNPRTRIEFNLPKAGHLGLKIFNVRGELVRTLIDEEREAGSDHIMWDGINDQGSGVSSGVYFYEARTAGDVVVGKMALVR